jgi:hypothetical protein
MVCPFIISEPKLMKKRFLIILTVLIACGATAAEVYKWTDANGVVHYSDAPNNQAAKIVEIPTAPVTTTNTSPAEQPPTATSTPSTSLNTTSTAEEQKQAIAMQKQNEAYCEQAKANLSLLQETGRRVYTVTPKGEYIYFNDEQRATEVKKTQEQIKMFCQPPSKP